jgi:hypothetical protein
MTQLAQTAVVVTSLGNVRINSCNSAEQQAGEDLPLNRSVALSV